MTVRAAVLDLLRAFGMTSIFGNPGSTELPLFRDFPKDFRYVLGLQESVVVGMADGYAQATHNAAFVNLHSAVGVGHAMGNIFTAYRNRTPLVVTAGQQARSILPYDPFLFSAQATELPRPYVKWSCEPARAEDVPLAIARGYYIAMQPPRGPVLVSIPADDWAKPCEPVLARVVSNEIRPEPRVLDAIGEALDTSLRPAFVVGAAVDRDGAWSDVVRLAERHNAAVWGAPMSGRCSFPEDHPLFAGFLPPMREKIVSLLVGHDVIFALGAAAFTYHVEGAGPHLPGGARLVQLIDDPNIAAWTPQGTSAVGSIRLGVLDLLARDPPLPRPRPALRREAPRVEPSTPMSVAFVMQTLAEIRDPSSIVVEEAPSSRQAMQRHLPILRSETFYTMCSGGLGYAMPAAVGIALGKPGAKVIALIGDGSSMYSIQALWSAAQLALPITFIIVKNRRYAALRDFAPTFGFAPDAVAKSAADGYTFLVTSGGAMTVDPFLYSSLPYDTQKDLTPVASLAIVRVFLMFHPSVPAKNFNEFVAYARANPGKLSYGSAGSGSSPHIAAEMFKRAARIDAAHVPYKGAAPALNDLLGGQVQFMFDPGPGLQHAATGKLTAIAVASAKRASRYPDVPTLEELGMRVDADTTFGVYAPAGVSAAIIERMNREINRTLNSQALVDNMARLGGEVAPMTIQEFATRQAADRARYGAFIKEVGIKVD